MTSENIIASCMGPHSRLVLIYTGNFFTVYRLCGAIGTSFCEALGINCKKQIQSLLEA